MSGAGAGGTLVGAVDVGGSGIRAAVVANRTDVGPVTERPVPGDPAAAVEAVLAAVTDLVRESGVAEVGLVVPGVVDDAAGTAVWSENIGWRDVPMRDLATRAAGVPVFLGHDVRAWGLAEWRYGAAAGAHRAAIVPVGTGIAAALVVDGRMLVAGGYAGEIGHLKVAAAGDCVCGQVGCLEAVASAAAVARAYAIRTGAGTPLPGGAATVARAVAAGDPTARAVWDEAVARLADGLAAIVAMVAPEVVVIGGGLARSGELLLGPLRAGLARRLSYAPVPDVRQASLGSAAALVGAAALVPGTP